ncbi:Alpha-2-macroglobulin-like protein 1 [Holothuria leucospilota]|uniref:Alpha-2-macroglobulin-like protein 1 n=1 Tax=Holothuria leucospilota TaxID=206669 RepID=A0A9Q1HBN0_HOLLE|nr:Alpha-2-macroglobulin-like protein 1 [Holothuria leucospilota]
MLRSGFLSPTFYSGGRHLTSMRVRTEDDVDEITSLPHEGPEESTDSPRLRSCFPETWLWDLLLVKRTGQVSVNLTVPDTITEWIANGFCISETKGIGISTTSSLQAFQPFFLSYTLPYSVIRGETFPVKVTVFNYMADYLVIELTLSGSENFSLASNEELRKSICVGSSQSSSVEFNIVPNIIGSMPIEESVKHKRFLSTAAFVSFLQAEGIKQEVTRSEFFCPSGDVMGPTLSNLDHLVQVPFGCGEQNMLTFVPNVLAMQYLTATDQLTPDVAKQATDNMKRGYQREFNFRHKDGSFSAFGKSDASGSTWLTAYVVRSFYQGSQFIEVDFDNLQSSINWLKGLQKPSGCFQSVGKVCHKDMLEEVIVRGFQCLESQVDSTDDNYALSQIAYAFALGNSTRCPDVLERLENVADYEGGKHWTSNREASTARGYYRPSSADVEMTSYILMAYLEVYIRSDIIAEGLSISRWLIQRRNSNGGFGSTQDTVVGLTALARFSEYTVFDDVDITLNIDSNQPQTNWGTTHQLHVTSSNRLVLHQLYFENVPTAVNFQGAGQGCALLQVSLFYNTYPEEPEEPEFYLNLTLEDHPQFPDCTRFEARVCAGYFVCV